MFTPLHSLKSIKNNTKTKKGKFFTESKKYYLGYKYVKFNSTDFQQLKNLVRK